MNLLIIYNLTYYHAIKLRSKRSPVNSKTYNGKFFGSDTFGWIEESDFQLKEQLRFWDIQLNSPFRSLFRHLNKSQSNIISHPNSREKEIAYPRTTESEI